MARLPDLIPFAQRHNLKMATIADLIAYRRRHDRIVERIAKTSFHSKFGGEFKTYVYVNRAAYAEHLALVKGDLKGDAPVLVRMHRLNVFRDLLGDSKDSHIGELQKSMEMIEEAGRGVIVLIREPWSRSLSDDVMERADRESAPPIQSRETSVVPSLRDYGVGAQILLDLGVQNMVLLTNSNRTIVGLEGYGLHVMERRPIPVEPR